MYVYAYSMTLLYLEKFIRKPQMTRLVPLGSD